MKRYALLCTLILVTLLVACSTSKSGSLSFLRPPSMTSAQCDMCKATIEKALANQDGLTDYRLDVTTQKLKVSYESGANLSGIYPRFGYLGWL